MSLTIPKLPPISLKANDLKKLARERLLDASVLYKAKRYEGAYYLCGYAVEMILKYRICKTLKWSEYPTSDRYKSFKTHRFEELLHLSGVEKQKNTHFFSEWSIVTKWDPEMRYSSEKQTALDVKLMIEATENIVKILC